MSDNLSIQGDLTETTVPDLFRTVVRSSETAILSLEGEGRNDTIFFLEGRIVYASSTDPDMGLAEMLLQSGDLDINQYNTALDRAVVARRIGSVLCELGYLKPDDLSRAAEQQVSAIVLDAMSYRSGSYSMEFVPELPDAIITLSLPTDRLILDGVRRIKYWSLISRGVGRAERLLQTAPDADSRTFQLELADDETQILALMSEPQSVEQLCTRSYLSDFNTLRTIWGLLAVNLLQDSESVSGDEKRAATENEYELEALVERYNGVYQQIFNRVLQKIGDHVYDFMDRVVVQLSPETLPFLSGMTFVNEGRLDFDQLLNNLYASGTDDHERVVRSVLDELLFGWVREVKSEFGGQPLDAEVMRIADELKGG